MPILVKCRTCKLDYHVADSAAGRRVKCRVCNDPITVPGEPRNSKMVVSESTLEELEKTGTPAQSDREAINRYKATISMNPSRWESTLSPARSKPGFFKKMKSWFNAM